MEMGLSTLRSANFLEEAVELNWTVLGNFGKLLKDNLYGL